MATCHRNGTSEAGTVDFSVRDNLEILFDTFKDTRKFNNIAESPGGKIPNAANSAVPTSTWSRRPPRGTSNSAA
ncbi:hypothetical protein [Rhizobium sp. BK376]|uniref:hypothetical protein n=1 Tax=Rhizobium sp. BK376 TaxID=2512149 RepID=UPI001FDFF48E|nr:hypothetical protein [Rhizobium sp. BK376]